MQHLQQYYL